MVFHGVILGYPGKCSLLIAPTHTHCVVEARLDSPLPTPAFDPLYSLASVEDEVWDNEAKCFVHCKICLDKVVGERVFSH